MAGIMPRKLASEGAAVKRTYLTVVVTRFRGSTASDDLGLAGVEMVRLRPARHPATDQAAASDY